MPAEVQLLSCTLPNASSEVASKDNIEVTGAARLYRAASVWTAGLVALFRFAVLVDLGLADFANSIMTIRFCFVSMKIGKTLVGLARLACFSYGAFHFGLPIIKLYDIGLERDDPFRKQYVVRVGLRQRSEHGFFFRCVHFLLPPTIAQMTFSTTDETTKIDIPVILAIPQASFIPTDMLDLPNDMAASPVCLTSNSTVLYISPA